MNLLSLADAQQLVSYRAALKNGWVRGLARFDEKTRVCWDAISGHHEHHLDELLSPSALTNTLTKDTALGAWATRHLGYPLYDIRVHKRIIKPRSEEYQVYRVTRRMLRTITIATTLEARQALAKTALLDEMVASSDTPLAHAVRRWLSEVRDNGVPRVDARFSFIGMYWVTRLTCSALTLPIGDKSHWPETPWQNPAVK